MLDKPEREILGDPLVNGVLGRAQVHPGRGDPGAVDADLRCDTPDECGDSGGIGEVARLEAHALDTVEPRTGPAGDARVAPGATRSKRADDARPDEAGSAGHERPH